MNIGENIRVRRVAKKMTQEQLGEKAAVSAAMISYIEADLKPLPLKTGYLIAKALGCTLDDLVKEKVESAV